jgi:Iron-containing alcohol dehydrogenase
MSFGSFPQKVFGLKTDLPPLWTLQELGGLDPETTAVWASPALAGRASAQWAYVQTSPDDPLQDSLATLIVVGGGTFIDRAKLRARDSGRNIRLIAVPSIWGSGAEASPIVVLDDNGTKDIRMDSRYLPDGRAIWPELAASIPPERAREACGDSWAHALEGFLSPLAHDDLRQELAGVIRAMLMLPLANDPGWFELSARACAGQSRSSVGLVHGLAHALESPIRAAQPAEGWHHARLCSLFLYPVMHWNRASSAGWSQLLAEYELDEAAIMAVARDLFNPAVYKSIVPILSEHWRSVLVNPCTRTNSTLVRPSALDYFRQGAFT